MFKFIKNLFRKTENDEPIDIYVNAVLFYISNEMDAEYNAANLNIPQGVCKGIVKEANKTFPRVVTTMALADPFNVVFTVHHVDTDYKRQITKRI